MSNTLNNVMRMRIQQIHAAFGIVPSFDGVRRRAEEQIRIGSSLVAQTGGPHNECVDAAHFLIPDGAAARQGDDPNMAFRLPALASLLGKAQQIERDTVRAWTEEQFGSVVDFLELSLGVTRWPDAKRLRGHRA